MLRKTIRFYLQCHGFCQLIFDYSGTETLVAITPSVVTTTSAAISRFRPVDRDCYDPSEFKLSKIPEEDGFRSVIVSVANIVNPLRS